MLAVATAGLAAALTVAAAPLASAAPPSPPVPTPTAPTGPPGGITLPQPISTPPAMPASPSAVPGDADSGSGGGGGSGGLFGWFDIGGHIRDAINGWFADLVQSALSPVLDLFGGLLLTSPGVTGGAVHAVWLTSLGIVDACLVLLVIAGGVLVMSHETLQTRYTVKDVLPRIVVAGIAVNISSSVVGLAIGVANALTGALLGQAPATAVASAFGRLIGDTVVGGGIFLTLLGGAVLVLALAVLVTFLGRTAVLILLAAGGPLLLAWHALPQTEGLARLWWRALGACLGVQVTQTLLLVLAVRVLLTPTGAGLFGLPTTGGLAGLLLVGVLLWLAIKIPFAAARMVTHRRSGGTRMVRYYVLHRALTAVKALGAAA